MPVAVEINDNLINSVTVVTKAGLRTLYSRTWLDATEAGTLVKLTGGPSPRRPDHLQITAHWQAPDWKRLKAPLPFTCSEGTLNWTITGWDNERVLKLELPGAATQFRQSLFAAIKTLHNEIGAELGNAFFSHASVKPFPVYHKSSAPELSLSLPSNLVQAVPGFQNHAVENLGSRYELGRATAKKLNELQISAKDIKISDKPALLPEIVLEETAEIAVAGLGTGGSLAAIAAGRSDAQTCGYELLDFAGGVGTGGGIPVYYWSVTGGLQDEIDDRTKKLMSLCGNLGCWGKGRFHHEAKRAILESMLEEAGVKTTIKALLFQVDKEGRKVKSCWFATPEGPIKVSAPYWIDATGDGDLCAFAGTDFEKGRGGDHLLHAYTQSGGYFRQKNGEYLTRNLNFDSGYVDPTDSEDLTRARIEGIHQHSHKPFDEIHRPNWLAPQLGLRQGRHIACDYQVTLDDLLERKQFNDAVGLTACHYDNHAVDYEFESDDALFLVWGCGLRGAPTACQIPYRSIIPKDLENCWIACRALGVTEDAHCSLRMQRDMQRIGEVAGLAAAMALQKKSDSRGIDFPELQKKLVRSGALIKPEEIKMDETFGKVAGPDHWHRPFDEDNLETRQRICLQALNSDNYGSAMWFLQKMRSSKLEKEILQLLEGDNRELSWRGAAIAAAWHLPDAEKRMISAIETREEGTIYASIKDDWKNCDIQKPVPHWWAATGLLRLCGTGRCLSVLLDLAGVKSLQINVRSSIAVTCAAIAKRENLSRQQKELIAEICIKLPDSPLPYSANIPTRDVVTGVDNRKYRTWLATKPVVEEDYQWQLSFAIATARKATGKNIKEEISDYAGDKRALVRQAFASLDT